ncbi:MAG: Ubiquinol oxidase subunit 2 [Candidatus Kaiserbacteria bacterium]|nr:Ubiquinol oxidase subunit 2 [Candidatus Kaiserbacteria bacterium]
MKFALKALALLIFAVGFCGILYYFTLGHSLGILQPNGVIALQERSLIIISVVLMLLVVVPVVGLSYVIAWRYRAENTSAKYSPEWSHSVLLETVWWMIPIFIICLLAAITWVSSKELDPYRQIIDENPTMTIEVVALNWKWLFIYPKEGIATLNFVEFPKDTPVRFVITADAPMNSFWIPRLGGQIYAMPGMQTQLNLSADTIGDYRGSSANFSGNGFSDMTFVARAVSSEDYATWVTAVQNSDNSLTSSTYEALVKPSESEKIHFYSQVPSGLYDTIIMKYMMPSTQMNGMDMNMTSADMRGI